jgi:hypothetical protein
MGYYRSCIIRTVEGRKEPLPYHHSSKVNDLHSHGKNFIFLQPMPYILRPGKCLFMHINQTILGYVRCRLRKSANKSTNVASGHTHAKSPGPPGPVNGSVLFMHIKR